MNIIDIGVDIVEIDRKKEALNKNEIESFKSTNFKVETIAGNFAAKEAISKAIGTGIRNFKFSDMEILRNDLGKPVVKTYNNLKQICIDFNVLDIKVSISHSNKYAVANAIAITKE